MPPKKKSGVGRALIKQKVKKNYSDRHTTEFNRPLQSEIDPNDLEEFISLATMAGHNFAEERGAPKVISETRFVTSSDKIQKFKGAIERTDYQPLSIPRRPPWTKEMTKEELHEKENDNFLKWRRDLAMAQESQIEKTMTPFEKNFEIWKQLWRVIERSDVVVTIVDARNPMFFRNPDLEIYVKEVDENKHILLLVNKADLLTKEQRAEWAEYFTAHDIKYMYFSAFQEQEFVDRSECRENQFGDDLYNDPTYIHSCLELLEKAKSLCDKRPITIGFIGYPNVGKSSVINAMCETKKVSVSATPGKTKHLQTIKLNEDVTLCDCPGLVFPSFLSSKAEMVLCGVLIVDSLTDYVSPVDLICLQVHSTVLEQRYKCELGGRVSASDFLSFVAMDRGFATGNGLPDENRVARNVLKDYVTGGLLYVHRPPGMFNELEDLAPEPAPEAPKEEKEPIRVFVDEDSLGNIDIESTGKLTKNQKRELKFAMRRGDDIGRKIREFEVPPNIMGKKHR